MEGLGMQMFPPHCFDLSTKANSYNLYGDLKYSTVNDIEDYNGIKPH
jgi:hypothetical protein